jgi:glyoxylase-like metal-dependent hydrolase (beta-lactamase superfamily II)
MNQEKKIIKQGKFNEYLHLIDLRQLGIRGNTSGYAAEFDDCSLFFDCGSSLEVKRLLRYVKNTNIDLSTCKYLITTHYHFDHNGGLWKLYETIKEYNPDVKILTNKYTKELLNDYEEHLARGKRSYGDLTGIMNPIEENAFKLIEPCTKFDDGLTSINIIDTFRIRESEVKLAILKTPGHTHDHQCPLFIKNNKIDFLLLGESVGISYSPTKLLALPVSVPPYFNYNDTIETLEKLKKLTVSTGGFCHFGVVNGADNVRSIIEEFEQFMKDFRADVKKIYNEKDETRYIVDKIIPSIRPRTEFGENNLVLQNIVLVSVYGMLMDLGYREE